MKQSISKRLATMGLLLACLSAKAQPLHQPIPNYTNDPYNRVGNASRVVNNPGGFSETTMGGIGVNGNYHYLVQNAVAVAAGYNGIILEKKDAGNGTSLGLTTINIGLQMGLSASTDFCRGLTMDVATNRIYIYGQTGSDAFIGCFDMTTLAPVSSFGTNGFFVVETGAEATGLVLTGVGNNVTLSINKAGTIILREYTSALSVVQSGTVVISNFTLASSYGSLKKSPNGHFFFAGSSTTSSGAKLPMIWDCVRNAGNYAVANSTSPATLNVGNGYFIDYDFYINPSPANPATYLFDVIAVGNNNSENGIYAKYVISTSVNFYTAETTFRNGASLPGTATPSNITTTGIRFTRCVMANNGYATVLGYFYNSGPYQAVVGYLTPSGNQYTTTYQAPYNSPIGITRCVHKTTALIKDNSGNILLSGCTMGYSYTVVKLSNTYDCRPAFNLKGSTSLINPGEGAALNANISTPNCTMVWKSISPTVATIYSGLPVSLTVYPNVTTTYECTVTNTATGCTSLMTWTVNVTVPRPEHKNNAIGTQSEGLEKELSLFPNPTDGRFTIAADGTFSSDFCIYDAGGKLILTIPANGEKEQQIDAGALIPGIYYIKVSVDGILSVKEFVIE